MRRFLLLVLLFPGIINLAYSQKEESAWLKPCGSPPGKSEWLKKYQQNPLAHLRSMDTTLYVPLTIHLVGQDNGSGYFGQDQLLNALCKLNADYEEANIRFYVEGDINFIPNSAWNNHSSVLQGAEMMFLNNVENTINCYFVSDPADNCGYNLPYAGIAMAKSCSGPNNDVWAHEIGHNLSVQHPFLGWEGGVSHDGSIAHNYSNPAPLTVTYDYTYFKDTLIADTLIIDTAYVEFVDGSNCTFAADGFCDTRPDYLAQRWSCNGNSESPLEQTDPSGARFRSDGSLVMGYANDACQSRFTPEQIAAMRANLYEEKADYLYNQVPVPAVSAEPVTIISPLADELVQYDAVYLEWAPMENATHYLLQISPVPNFSGALASNYIVTANSITLPEALAIDRNYYWRVRAYNSHSFCNPATDDQRFRTAQLSAVNTLGQASGFSLSPNPIATGQALMLEFEARQDFSASLQLRTAAGQLLQSQKLKIHSGINQIPIAADKLSPGLYLVWVEGERGRAVQRLAVY